MSVIWMDVDAALSEVPVNCCPLISDSDFKTVDEGIAYNESGMDLYWHFTTTGGATSVTSVTPTTGGDYDWAHQDHGMYTIEIPASGGASINNDTEGFGYFTGVCDNVLPWRGPTIGFRAAALNNALIDGGDNLDVNTIQLAGDADAPDKLIASLETEDRYFYEIGATVAIGDLCYMDSNNVVQEASQQADAGSEPSNQETFAQNFVGVCVSTPVVPAGFGMIASRCVRTFTCPSDTYTVGQLVGPDETGGNQLLDQTVAKVSERRYAIGVVAVAVPVADTSVEVMLFGRAPTIDWEDGRRLDAIVDAVRLALPSAAPDAAGGLPISDAGELDLDTQLAYLDAAISSRNSVTPDAAGTAAGLHATTDGKVDGVQTGVTSALGNLATLIADNPNVPTKGVAFTLPVLMVDEDDSKTGLAGLTVAGQISKDNGAFAALDNTPATELAFGMYYITITATEMNANTVTLRFTATGADDRFITLVNQPT